jgi:hypothetical protein
VRRRGSSKINKTAKARTGTKEVQRNLGIAKFSQRVEQLGIGLPQLRNEIRTKVSITDGRTKKNEIGCGRPLLASDRKSQFAQIRIVECSRKICLMFAEQLTFGKIEVETQI